MYAVIETGGKQYRVELGSELVIERLEADPGATVNFDRVLLVADGDNAQIGTPVVSEALVTASVVRQDRGDKVIVFKYRPKARRRVKKGHRQEQTVVRVADIRFNGRSAADEANTQEKQASKARQAAAAEAERKAAADQVLAEKLAADAEATAKEAAETAEADAKPAPAKRTRATAKAQADASDKPKSTRAKPAAAADDADDGKPAKPKTRRTTTKKDE